MVVLSTIRTNLCCCGESPELRDRVTGLACVTRMVGLGFVVAFQPVAYPKRRMLVVAAFAVLIGEIPCIVKGRSAAMTSAVASAAGNLRSCILRQLFAIAAKIVASTMSLCNLQPSCLAVMVVTCSE